jgi:hypothetical protein
MESVNPAVPWRSIIKANCLRRTYGEVTLFKKDNLLMVKEHDHLSLGRQVAL